MASRCYGCFQENCGYVDCKCSCHVGHEEDVVARTKPAELAPKSLATFYAVRNEKGQFYRTYSMRGTPAGWENKLEDARLWTRPGGANGIITSLTHNPKAPVPDLVEFVVTELKVIDQKQRVVKARQKREEEAAWAEQARKQERLRQAEIDVEQAQARLKKLQGK